MVEMNSLKRLFYFLLGMATAAVCMRLYVSMHQDGRIEGAQLWKIGRKLTAEHQGLTRMLKNAAMDDRTVILTTLNEEWTKPNSILDLFLESFHVGERTERLLSHVIIIAMDSKAFQRCKSVHTHCHLLTTEGFDSTPEKMTWRRFEFLRVVLKLGYSFLYTDMDIMWFRNPFQRLSGKAVLQFATDVFNGNPLDLHSWPNVGFFYAKSCEETIEFFRYWYMAKFLYPGTDDRTLLHKISYDMFVSQFYNILQFLDTRYFGGFCQPSKDFNKVCTMHANCCVGVERKLHDLRILLEDWKNYTSRTAEERKRGVFFWRIPDKCNSEP